jgi:hypothetical protein
MDTPIITELSRGTAHPAQRAPIAQQRRPQEARIARPPFGRPHRAVDGPGGLARAA